jgi:hypothetical protein
MRAQGSCGEEFVDESFSNTEADATWQLLAVATFLVGGGRANLLAPVIRMKSCSWAETASQGAVAGIN